MISNAIYIGIIVALAISVILPIGCIVYCIKKGGTKGTPMFILIGLASALLVTSLKSLAGSFLPMEAVFNTSFVLFLVADSLLLVILDAAAKTFAVNYSKKTGVGLYRGFAIGAGFGAGNVLFTASDFFQYMTYVKMMNEGTFVSAIVEQDPTMELEAIQFQESLAAAHPMSFFITALERGTIIFFDIALILLLLNFISKKKTAMGIAIIAAVKFTYTILINLVSYSSTEYLQTATEEGTALSVMAVIYVITLVASIYFIIKISKVIPKEAKAVVPLNPYKKIKEDEAARAQKRAWSEVSRLNVRNIKSPEERTPAQDADNTDDASDDIVEAENYENDEVVEAYDDVEEAAEDNDTDETAAAQEEPSEKKRVVKLTDEDDDEA